MPLESLLEILHTIENCLKPRKNPWKIPVTVLIFVKFARNKPATLLKYELFSAVLQTLNLDDKKEKQPPRGVLSKRCSENMQNI